MKKLMMAVLLVVLVIGAGMIFLVSNLDGLVKRAIETAGSRALGVPVTVQSVSIDLGGGSASLQQFAVANPPGYSDQALLSFDELSVAIDIRSLSSDVIRITRISSTNPRMHYELQGTQGNVNVVLNNLPASEPAPTSPAGPDPVLAIDELAIAGIQGSLQSDQLPRVVTVNLGDVRVGPVQGTPEELARQIARPLLTQLARNAAGALSSAAAGAMEDELRERADQQLEQIEGQARDAVQGLRDRLRGQ